MKKNFIFSVIAAVLMLSFVLAPTSGLAAHYTAWFSRGVDNITYIKNDFSWTANKTKITGYDATQKISGILVKAKGVSKEKTRSTKTRTSLLCKASVCAGVSMYGFTFGWEKDVNDRIYLYNNGKSLLYLDV